MLFTNGKQIVIDNGNLNELDTFIQGMQTRARELNGNKKIKFSFHESPYPHYNNNDGLSYDQLKEAADGVVELNFRALGNEIITLPGKKTKDIKHHFSLEEIHVIGTDFAQLKQSIELLEDEKKQSAKEFAARLDAMETKLSHYAALYRQGHEIRTEQVLVQFDYPNRMKYFLNPENQEMLHSEDMKADDYQMKLEYIDGSFGETEVPAGTATGGGEETDEVNVAEMNEAQD